MRRYYWLAVLLFFAVAVALKLNGSSVATWDQVFHVQPSNGLLLFKPQPIRTDEWLVWTPAALSQVRAVPRFPVSNPNLGPGRAPLLLNLPVAYYTTFFRPQLWGFFFLDFERGFSFCWWTKFLGALFAPAWLLYRLGVRSRGIALFGGACIFLSLQWWFSSPAMVPEMIATWSICTGCATLFYSERSRWRLGIAYAAFVFFGVNFVLCFYPPAQIPLLYVTAAIVAGFAIEHRRKGNFYRPIVRTLVLAAAVTGVAVVLLRCYLDLRPTFDLVAQTIYPGARRSSGGALSFFWLFSGLTSFFQTHESMPRAFTNLTLPNHWFPIWPVVALVAAVAHYRGQTKASPILIALTAVIVLLHVYCLVILPQWLLRSSLLAFSTEFSSQFAVGPANILLTCLFLDRYRAKMFSKLEVSLFSAIFILGMALLFWTASLTKPDFFPVKLQIVLSFVASAILLVLFFSDKRQSWFTIGLVALLVLSVGNVNPVMRGLSPLLDSKPFQAVTAIRQNDPDAKWIVYNSLELPEIVKATGVRVLNGFKIVPDLTFDHVFDPAEKFDFVYDRYGHLVMRLPERPGQIEYRFVAADLYMLFVSPGDSQLSALGCRYLVLPELWSDAELHGFSLFVEVPGQPFCIYRQQ